VPDGDVKDIEQMQSNKAVLTIAIIAPLVIGWFGVQIQFWFGVVIASPLGLVPAVILGVFASTRVTFESSSSRYIFITLFTIASIVVLPLVGLLTSCVNGDCIYLTIR